MDEPTSLGCGNYTGIIVGTVLGAIVCAVIIAQPRFLSLGYRILVGAAALLMTALLCWWTGGFLGKRAQQVGRTEIDAYKTSGMTEQEAVRNVQNLQNNQRIANSILAAGSAVAGSMTSR